MRNFLLLLVAFLSGTVLMGLELAGSRVLAIDFGGSIYVWGSLIGIFMAALSAGYYLGGWLVDRVPRAWLLALLLLIGGLWIVLLSVYSRPVTEAIAGRDLGERVGPLVACLALFFVPGMLMGAASPFVIRLTASTVTRVGQTSGIVYAISTLGSIAGAIGVSFFILELKGIKMTLLWLGIGLLLTGVLCGLVELFSRARQPALHESKHHRQVPTVLLAVAFLALLSFGQPARAEKILTERDSAYQHLFVTEDNGNRILRTNDVYHSRMSLKDPNGRGWPYTDYTDIAFLYNPNIRNVLVIGLGGGTVPKRFVRDYPQVNVDVIEIDPVVIELARKYFYVKPGPRLYIYSGDGRVFLKNKAKKQYDLIFLDAYYSDAVPFFLTTREFFKIVNDHLTPNGILVNNFVGAVSGPRSKFFRAVYLTTQRSFPQTHVFRVPGTRPLINIELFGLKTKQPVSVAALRQRLPNSPVKDKKLMGQLLNNYVAGPIPTKDVQVLTDDNAPVDALLHLW